MTHTFIEQTAKILRLAVEFVKIFLVGVNHSDAIGWGAAVSVAG